MLLNFFMFPGMSAEASSGRLALGVIPGSPQKQLTVLPTPAPEVFQRHPKTEHGATPEAPPNDTANVILDS